MTLTNSCYKFLDQKKLNNDYSFNINENEYGKNMSESEYFVNNDISNSYSSKIFVINELNNLE